MRAVVIDTNVIVVANEHAIHADDACELSCVKALEKARYKQRIVIDSGMLLFEEYFKYANRSGQPHVGDAFVKWLWVNQSNSKRCEQVRITPRANEPDNFAEFPQQIGLKFFDRSDRKFVAVARASKYHPSIINAVDTDWWIFRDQLKQIKVSVKFLCPQMMKLRKKS
jgi:hypothetical protein